MASTTSGDWNVVVVDVRTACRAIRTFPTGMRLRQEIDFRLRRRGGNGIHVIVVILGGIVIQFGIVVRFAVVVVIVGIAAGKKMPKQRSANFQRDGKLILSHKFRNVLTAGSRR